MSFIIPFLPAIGSAIGGLFGSKGSGGGSSGGNQQFDDILKQLGELGTKAGGFEDAAMGRGKKDWKSFRKNLGFASDYWRDLMTADRQALTTALAPELNQVNQNYSSALRNAGEFGPRGGGGVSTVNALQGQRTSDINNLFFSARPRAAQQLQSIAPLYANSALGQGQLGLGFGNQAMDASQSSLSALLGQARLDAERRGQTLGAAGGLGKGLGDLIGWFLNRSKSGGGGGPFNSGGTGGTLGGGGHSLGGGFAGGG